MPSKRHLPHAAAVADGAVFAALLIAFAAFAASAAPTAAAGAAGSADTAASAAVSSTAASTVVSPAASPAASTTTRVDEASMLATLRSAHRATPFTAARWTDVPGLFEVWMGDNVAYVAASNPRYFVFGRMVDTQTLRDVTGSAPTSADAAPPTAPVRAAATPAAVPSAPGVAPAWPLADAITRVRGSGSRVLVVFSDPACGFCRALEHEIARLDDVTVHTFVVGFVGRALPQSILCEADPARAWHDVVVEGRPAQPAVRAGCAHPLERNTALAQSLGVRGTPTLFYADGSRAEGLHRAEQIDARLAAAAHVVARTAPAARPALEPARPQPATRRD